MNEEESAGRVVIVTGGGTGIGKEIARAFAQNGDDVVVCGRSKGSLEAAAGELGENVSTRVCDVSDEASVAGLVEETLARRGRIDVLVNNAGVYGPIGRTIDNATDAWREAMTINLFGVFLTTRAVGAVMARQGGGAIINISGGGATSSKPRYSAYAAAKSGVVRLTEVVADELAPDGVRVNAIAPGFIVTRFHDETLAAGAGADPDVEKVRAKIESGGDDPRKTAELALFLAGAESEGISGKIFSAIWDDWRDPAVRAALRDSRDLYTLRRVDNVMFHEDSGQ
jgi:3-oxoacyl-[acyl-carrier protein] reductase